MDIGKTMARNKQFNRIENAIKERNPDELQWAKEYANLRIKKAHIMHPPKIAKQAKKSWGKILEDIKEVISSLNDNEY